MDLSHEIEHYIRESIEYSLGLPVSTHTLELKIRVSEEAQRRLRDQCLYLQARLKEKDEIIERSRAESSMNAQALKKFVEENQILAIECSNLLSQCTKWERECSMYDGDREVLMDFGNEADERAKEADIRVRELEEESRRLSKELQFYKHQCGMHLVGTSTECTSMEQLLDSLHAFLEANSGVEVCQRMLKLWNSMRPSTQKVLALAAEVESLQKDKEHLRINLHRAEEEVKVLFEENNILNKENKRLTRQCHKERCHSGGKQSNSGGKQSNSESAKGNKRKSSPEMSSPAAKKIDFIDFDSPRQPLSPLHHNSHDSKMRKK